MASGEAFPSPPRNYRDFLRGRGTAREDHSGDDEGALRGLPGEAFDGGMVTMPLEKAPGGDTFGMCVDRFGVSWMFNITGRAV
jgi:hypothetical protein